MSEPVVFISHFRVKGGKLDELKGSRERSNGACGTTSL